MTTEECSRWNRQIAIMLVTYCYAIKVFSCSDDIRIFVESPIAKVVKTKQWFCNDKVVIARLIVQYWLIFSSFLIFFYYFTCLKAREISCKIWETRKILAILHSAPCDNSFISLNITKCCQTSFNSNIRFFW